MCWWRLKASEWGNKYQVEIVLSLPTRVIQVLHFSFVFHFWSECSLFSVSFQGGFACFSSFFILKKCLVFFSFSFHFSIFVYCNVGRICQGRDTRRYKHNALWKLTQSCRRLSLSNHMCQCLVMFVVLTHLTKMTKTKTKDVSCIFLISYTLFC